MLSARPRPVRVVSRVVSSSASSTAVRVPNRAFGAQRRQMGGRASSNLLSAAAAPSAALSAAACIVTTTVGNGVSNGAIAFMMRHRKKLAKLGRPADQRKALMRSLTTELLRYGRIKTTQAKAKAMRKPVDHMITLAKRGTDWDMVQAMAYLYDKQLVKSLFEAVPDRYSDREGGYTRIYKTMPRRGDNAPMAIIELV